MFADEASKKPLEIVYVTNITEKAPPARKPQGSDLHLLHLIVRLYSNVFVRSYGIMVKKVLKKVLTFCLLHSVSHFQNVGH